MLLLFSTITRLEDMGIESYLIADSVIGVIAQRLVRRLCPFCKKPKQATKDEKEFMGMREEEDVTIYEPCGFNMEENIHLLIKIKNHWNGKIFIT